MFVLPACVPEKLSESSKEKRIIWKEKKGCPRTVFFYFPETAFLLLLPSSAAEKLIPHKHQADGQEKAGHLIVDQHHQQNPEGYAKHGKSQNSFHRT